ncbi:MAG: aminotransferase class IV, partial [Myxococcales bacterium]|nr:aminotransferase class IV [Polyangiaceae bacterium]MDW8251915.1 aminotransferase class IV [Myxococcales bacterium]
QRLGMDAREPLARLREEAEVALRRVGPGEWLVRLLLSRGEPGGQPTRVVLVEPLVPPAEEVYLRGVSVELHPHPGGTLGPKTLAYLPHLLARDQARSRGAEEVIFLDEDGYLGQGSTCNVLLARKGKLIAPAPAGGRAGVTRRFLLEVAPALGWTVEVRGIRPEELGEGAELMLCSTIREVMPVVRAGGRVVGSGSPGATARGLREVLRRGGW